MERRTTSRLDVEGIKASWRVRPRSDGPSASFPSGPAAPQAARLLDVSLTGMLVEAPAADDLAPGHVVTMTIDGHTGPVAIRRIGAPTGSSTWRYGVELVDVASSLTTYVHTTLSDRAADGRAVADDATVGDDSRLRGDATLQPGRRRR